MQFLIISEIVNTRHPYKYVPVSMVRVMVSVNGTRNTNKSVSFCANFFSGTDMLMIYF